jgi:hypothetical protein
MTASTDSLHIVTRNFRGTQLYLVSHDTAGKSFVWSSDKRKAPRVTLGAALYRAKVAQIEYGADCIALAADGALVQAAAVPCRVPKTQYQKIAARRARGLAVMSPGRPKGSKNGVKS